MIGRLLVVVIILLFFVFGVSLTYSQESATFSAEEQLTAFEKLYKDYITQFDRYREAHSDYLLARSQYLQAKTLVSQTKARDETAKMLIARDEVVVSYLFALRARLQEAKGISDVIREGLYKRIDTEIRWFRDHRQRITSAGSLEDLVEDSQEASKHFISIQGLIYETLSVIPLGKVDDLRKRAVPILSDIKDKANEIRDRGDHDISVVERWIIETENKLNRSLDKRIDAQSLLSALQASDSGEKVDYKTSYSQIIDSLQESLQFLKEANSFMREIVRAFKIKT